MNLDGNKKINVGGYDASVEIFTVADQLHDSERKYHDHIPFFDMELLQIYDIWLDGVPGLDITDMHIDSFARFGENNAIVTMSRKNLREWKLSEKDIYTLYNALNMQGLPYKYVTLPLTKNNVVTTYGEDLGYKGSYVNSYITNDRVLVPNDNDPNDPVANNMI